MIFTEFQGARNAVINNDKTDKINRTCEVIVDAVMRYIADEPSKAAHNMVTMETNTMTPRQIKLRDNSQRYVTDTRMLRVQVQKMSNDTFVYDRDTLVSQSRHTTV